MTEIPPRNVENAVYNPLTDMWMIPQNDPYTMENFQQAYDNLASGKSLQTLTRAETAEFSEDEQLEPTHFALRIYPKTEDEQWKVEMMEDVNVVYTPFNYAGLTAEEVELVPQTRAEVPSPFEVSPYTVTYDYTDATDGGPTGPVTYQLPVLYAVWPADKPLPDDMEYVIDYNMFRPDANSPHVLRSGAYMSSNPVQFVTYDNTLGKNVPLANIKVRAYTDNYSTTDGRMKYAEINTTTDGNGIVYVGQIINERIQDTDSESAQHEIYFSLTYQDMGGRWKITSSTNTAPFSTLTFREWIDVRPSSSQPKTISVPLDNYQLGEIWRATNYFFNEQSVFSKDTSSGGMNIRACSTSNPDVNGLFSPGSRDILIWNNNLTNGQVIGTTLHEIGHYAHYWNNSGMSVITIPILRESFGSYSGWYLGEEYYKSLGWVQPYDAYDITGNARQFWYYLYPVPEGRYSPLFVDLTDSFNQINIDTGYPMTDDDISNVPASVIWDVITSVKTWDECKAKLRSYIGIYYTEAELNNNIFQIDIWNTLHENDN